MGRSGDRAIAPDRPGLGATLHTGSPFSQIIEAAADVIAPEGDPVETQS
jgi:hypothetical protein